MTSRTTLAPLLLAGLFLPPGAQAQMSPPAPRPAAAPYMNHSLVFLDPAHGGDDTGARLSDHALEKDTTIALATRLRALLTAGGLTVLLAREPDAAAPDPDATPGATPVKPPAPPPTADQRAGAANHVHPFACVLLHSTASGSGVHVVTSPLPEPDSDNIPTGFAVPWATVQSTYVAQSNRLAAELSTALARAGLPTQRAHASVRPIDSLSCPAVAIELAPAAGRSASDTGYQQRVAQAVATALLFWRGHADPPAPGPDPGTGPGQAGSAP